MTLLSPESSLIYQYFSGLPSKTWGLDWVVVLFLSPSLEWCILQFLASVKVDELRNWTTFLCRLRICGYCGGFFSCFSPPTKGIRMQFSSLPCTEEEGTKKIEVSRFMSQMLRVLDVDPVLSSIAFPSGIHSSLSIWWSKWKSETLRSQLTLYVFWHLLFLGRFVPSTLAFKERVHCFCKQCTLKKYLALQSLNNKFVFLISCKRWQLSRTQCKYPYDPSSTKTFHQPIQHNTEAVGNARR